MHLPRVWVDVDLDQLARNLAACRRLLRSGCGVLGVVKADAYGHGAVPVARALEASGIAMLGVGDSHEAIRLREAGIRSPMLILGAVVEGEIPDLIRHGITPMIHSPERIALFHREAARLRCTLPVHLLVDTGMSRLGLTPGKIVEHLRTLRALPNVTLRGIGTHLASPVEDPGFTRLQLDRFASVLEAARTMGVRVPLRHAASSAALQLYPEAHLDLVRVGGLLYGVSVGPRPEGVRPVLSLNTQIVYLRDHPAETPIGYGGTYHTRRRTRVATLPIGYHDGYLHHLSNRAEVLVHGRRVPVVGGVTMDYVMIDVTDVPGASVGDHVTLIGENGQECVTVEELAGLAETTPYEIPCQIGNRVRRFYRQTHFPTPMAPTVTSPTVTPPTVVPSTVVPSIAVAPAREAR